MRGVRLPLPLILCVPSTAEFAALMLAGRAAALSAPAIRTPCSSSPKDTARHSIHAHTLSRQEYDERADRHPCCLSNCLAL